jgi:hypothetical protein
MNGPLEKVLDTNTSFSADAISEAISSYVEACITDAVKSLPPETVPSPAQARLRKMMTKRRGKSRGAMRQRISNHESNLLELYQLRRDLDGHVEDGTAATPTPYSSTTGSITDILPEQSVGDTPNGHLERKEDASIKRISRMIPSFHGSVVGAHVKEPAVQGSLEPAVANIVIVDRVFEQVVKTVETSLRAFAMQRDQPISFAFQLGKDPEYPKWKRYIVRLNSPLDFDSKMKLWTEMDASIREEIRRLSHAKPEISGQIENISSNLFLHMEL